jgi:hypothetical protein
LPTFLNPALLWGLALAAVPILIHLLHRRRYRRLQWAAMEFLLAALRKHQRRLRLENLLLLIVRTLILLLLALAITRPFFADSAALGALQRGRMSLILVVDNSFSTGLKDGLTTPFDRAVEQARLLVGSLEREDTVTVVLTADNVLKHDLQPRAVLQESADLDKVRGLLGRLRVSSSRSALAPALRAAREVLATPAESRRLVVLSDLQVGFWEGVGEDEAGQTARDLLEQIHDGGVDVAVLDVGSPEPRNVTIASIRPAYRRATVASADSTWLVGIENHGPVEARVDLTLRVDDRKVESRALLVPASSGPEKPGRATESYRLSIPNPGHHSITAEITTDELPVDDRRTHALTVRDRIRVLAVDGDPNPRAGRRPETFLLKNSLEIRRSGPIEVDVVDVLGLLRNEVEPYDLIVLANVDRLREETVAALERYVDEGGALVIFLGDRVDPEMTNQALLKTDDGLLPARLGRNEIRARDDPARFLFTAADHPMLRDLTAVLDEDTFPSPLVYGFNRVTPVDTTSVRVLATYDDLERSPAIVERRRGRGRVLLYTTAADDGWADLGPSPVYVALLHDMVHDLTWRDPGRENRLVGQVLEVTLPEGAEDIQVDRPRGNPARLDPLRKDGRTFVVFADTEEPGLYTLSFRPRGIDPLARDEGGRRRQVFAFGLDAQESDLHRLPPEGLRARLRDLDVPVAREADAILARPSEARQGEIWRILLFLVLGLLALECWLARRFGDYERRESA